MKDSGERQQGNDQVMGDDPGRFSPAERQALAAWRAPTGPAGFADRVLAAWEVEAAAHVPHPARSRAQPLRGAAVAAVALLLLGGFFSVKSFLVSGSGPGVNPAAGFTAHDGGPVPEVRPQAEGGGIEVDRQPS